MELVGLENNKGIMLLLEPEEARRLMHILGCGQNCACAGQTKAIKVIREYLARYNAVTKGNYVYCNNWFGEGKRECKLEEFENGNS